MSTYNIRLKLAVRWLHFVTEAAQSNLAGSLTMLYCKAGKANTSLKTATCEAGPGTTLTYIYEIYIWSFLIQEFVDECCDPNSNVT